MDGVSSAFRGRGDSGVEFSQRTTLSRLGKPRVKLLAAGTVFLVLSARSFSDYCCPLLRGFGVVIEPIEDEIRELCARLAAADSSELPEVVAELHAALKQHADQLRLMTLRTIKAFPSSKSKTK